MLEVAQDSVQLFHSAHKILRRGLDLRYGWLLLRFDYLSYEVLIYRAAGLDYSPGCASIIHSLSACCGDRSIELPGKNIALDFIGDVGLLTPN